MDAGGEAGGNHALTGVPRRRRSVKRLYFDGLGPGRRLQMAFGEPTRAAHRHRRNAGALRQRESATWMERAAGRRIDRIRECDTELRVGNAAARFGREHRFEQRLRVGMPWVAKE